MKYYQAAAILAFTAGANAHMKMFWPKPFAWDTLDQAPLAPADYPCKQRAGGYQVTEMNEWNAGETKEVEFIGSAVHGGGSCQFSISTDKEPTPQSQWKVLHSAIGGCPATAEGNLTPNAENREGLATFPVTMPSDLPAGQYTFAWSWFNKLGNREFYMNCAPIKVGGGKRRKRDVSSALGGLPDMFVANLPDTECKVAAEQDFEFPNPGKSVTMGPSAKPGNAMEGAGCEKQNAMGAGSGSLGSPAPATGGSGNTDTEEPTEGETTTPTEPAEPQQSAPAQQPAEGTNPTPADPPASGSGSSSGDSSCSPCTEEGGIVCIGSDKFGICNRGCAIPQPVAAGTTCSNGQLARRDGLKFPRRF